MDPHQLHNNNNIPPWAQHPPPSSAAVHYNPVGYSAAANFPGVNIHPHGYVSQQPLTNFPVATPPAQPQPQPVQTAPPTVQAPSPAPVPAAAPAASPAQPSGEYHPAPMPSYAEMIFGAISMLKERDGSSRRAIAKYIDKAYSDLPPAHDALLTQNLKRLKASGMLVMNKKSYMLPRSDFPANINELPDTSIAAAAHPLPVSSQPQAEGTTAASIATPLSASAGLKRGRGRPPKPKPTNVVLPNGQPESQTEPVSQPQPKPAAQVTQPAMDVMPPGFAPNGQPTPPSHFTGDINVEGSVEPNVEGSVEPNQPVVVPIEVVADAGEGKRRPGRPPKKLLGVDASGLAIVKRGRGRPPLGLGAKKKSPGRPRKPKPKTVAAVSGTNGYKRRPGRPPKNLSNSVLVPYAMGEVVASAPRPRGRPRKGTGSIAAGVGVGGYAEKLSDGAMQPRRSGRPVGRPRKYLDGADTDGQGGGSYRKKLLLFQKKVREVALVLRPQLSNEAPQNVVTAVEELEDLAKLDIDQELEFVQSNQNPERVHMEEARPLLD